MEVIINANETIGYWKVEAGDIVTQRDWVSDEYYIVVKVDTNDFLLLNLNNEYYEKFETTTCCHKDEEDIKKNYMLVSKHNNVKVTFSW